jgi:putative hydrolase of the HAD superfamily
MFTNIKRILFDSGGVLIYPKSGEWMFPLAYKEYCLKRGLPEKTSDLEANFETAIAHLNKINTILTETEEFSAFHEFYRLLFHNISNKDNDELIDLCTRAKVLDYSQYLFFDDVRSSIIKLQSRFNLGVITDAWPSILNVYKQAKMLNYFNPFLISSLFGTTKPEKMLFKIALNSISEQPHECLFIDDHLSNCKIAQGFGMRVLGIDRNSSQKEVDGIFVINTLSDLEPLLH